jgi:vancomycin permeability regulator SanA
LPAPLKLCLKTIESIKEFKVSIIVTSKEYSQALKINRMFSKSVDICINLYQVGRPLYGAPGWITALGLLV